MPNNVTIWNTDTINGAATNPPQPFPIGTQTGCSIRIDNNTQYGLQILEGTSPVDYVKPNSHIIRPMASDYTVALDTSMVSNNIPANPTVSYTILSGVHTYAAGSTNFSGTQQVNIANASIPVSGNVNATIENASINTQSTVVNEYLNVSGAYSSGDTLNYANYAGTNPKNIVPNGSAVVIHRTQALISANITSSAEITVFAIVYDSTGSEVGNFTLAQFTVNNGSAQVDIVCSPTPTTKIQLAVNRPLTGNEAISVWSIFDTQNAQVYSNQAYPINSAAQSGSTYKVLNTPTAPQLVKAGAGVVGTIVNPGASGCLVTIYDNAVGDTSGNIIYNYRIAGGLIQKLDIPALKGITVVLDTATQINVTYL